MEQTYSPLNAAQAFADCEALWPQPDAREAIRRAFDAAYATFHARVMVLDDDPTGVQTVHDITVVTAWDVDTLYRALSSGERMFFVLTNSRSFSAEKTVQVHREIARNAMEAARKANVELMIVSRGDSTLRGHYPLETDTLRDTLEAEGMPAFSGEVLCPYFREGGRFTIGGVHYVREGEVLTPAAQTEFAKDKTFGYKSSELAAYIREKSAGRIAPEQIVTLTLQELRSLDFDAIEQRLLQMNGYHCIAADAVEEADVQALAVVLMRLMARGRHYVIRSAAAVPKVLGNVPDRPLLRREEMISPDSTVGGLVLVGSHVKKTTDQLNCLRESGAALTFIEFSVNGWQTPDGLTNETRRTVALAEEAMRAGRTAVVYTSRQLVLPEGATPEELLAISVRISEAVTNVVGTLSFRPRFLIAKGGITSSDVGTKALRVKQAKVLGQAQPGIPVWQTGPESLFPGLSYIIFPGNVGSVSTLRTIVEELA
ncbi:MAG: four-carbon acid sugar kinase family protein [Aristaeellaceae bacterium]